MRVLFTFIGGWGHAEPLVSIARAMEFAGHDVVFAAQTALVSQVEACGFRALACGPTTVGSTKQPLIAPDRQHEVRVLRDHFAGTFARAKVEGLATLSQQWCPEVIVCDEVDFGAMIAAQRLGIPYASVVVLAAGSMLRPQLVADALNELLAEYGLERDPDMTMLSRHLVLVPVPPVFRDPTTALPSTAHLIRPAALQPPPMGEAGSDGVENAANQPRLRPSTHDAAVQSTGKPVVYVTLGTIFNLESGDLFSRLIAAVGAMAVEVIVTLGSHLDPAEYGVLPENVRIEQFIPQALILPQCDAVVCHAGSGTVIGALSYGVPLVLFPMGADQPDNADRCESLGVGICLDALTATPQDIRGAVTRVLTDPRWRRNARLVQSEIVALPPAESAVALLEELRYPVRHETGSTLN